MSAVYPYHPDRPRNMINTNKLFDLYYAAEDSEDTTGVSKPSIPVLAKPTKSALKRRKTKRQVPARLKFFWDETSTTSESSQKSTDSSPSSSKPELLPICLQASVIDSNPSIQLPKTLQFETSHKREPQTSFVFSFPQSKSEAATADEQSTDSLLLQQNLLGPITFQHLMYLVCLGALFALVWQYMDPQTQTQTQIQNQIQTQIQTQAPYFPSSSFTLTSATLSPSISAVRIFVAHQHQSQFSFTLLRTRLFAR